MDEDEHEVYGGEIPDVADMEGDMDHHRSDADISRDALKLTELNDMKRRLKDMEEEASALRELQAKVEREMGTAQGSIPRDSAKETATQATKDDPDARSVFVGNVDYSCTPEEVQQHFQSCGTVNRVTILTDKFGRPKGFAYVEFLEIEAVQQALLLTESQLHARVLKVCGKRTNIPGMKNFHPRRPFMGYGPRGPYVPHYSPYGKFPRFRRPNRYMPYGGHYY